jgi:hypothetical protein
VTRKHSAVSVSGARDKKYNKLACDIKCHSNIGGTQCDNCKYCEKIEQKWQSDWGAITRDKKIRFDYHFEIDNEYVQKGYCVLDIDEKNPNKLTGHLMTFPPRHVPAKIEFEKIT